MLSVRIIVRIMHYDCPIWLHIVHEVHSATIAALLSYDFATLDHRSNLLRGRLVHFNTCTTIWSRSVTDKAGRDMSESSPSGSSEGSGGAGPPTNSAM